MKTAHQVLSSWKTIYAGKNWYILTQEAKDIIEDAVVNGPTDEKIRLELATKKNGEGTGKFQSVSVEALAGTVSEYTN